jgi:Fuc2NAc and GlcNAc transferase
MMLAVFSIQAAWVVPNLFWSWIIMLAVFVVDASVTLIRRMLAGGGKYLHAHRSHAYQHAARKYGTHKTVSLTIGAINVVWLWPLALAVGLGYLNAAWGLLIAYLPLVGLAIGFRAGADER